MGRRADVALLVNCSTVRACTRGSGRADRDLVSFLLPRLEADGAAWALSLTSVAAVSGRLLLAGTIARLHQRRAAAARFASQAVGLGLFLAFFPTPGAL